MIGQSNEAAGRSVFGGKRVLITGATGSLGGAVLRRILDDVDNPPAMIRVFSRDEAKQYRLRSRMEEEYEDRAGLLDYMIGDVRNMRSLNYALADVQIVIHAAALKHVPVCEKNTAEAIETNVMGASNLVDAVSARDGVEKVVGLSTDKACAPFSLMGMTKAVQERVFAAASARTSTIFSCVRMGNMIMSRGSIVPLFLDQIRRGGPITITDPRMTRFFITLRQAADHIVTALACARAGEVYVPPMKAVSIMRLAQCLARGTDTNIEVVGIRPGEKLSDILISKDEKPYTVPCPAGGYMLIPQTTGPACVGNPVAHGQNDLSSADHEVQMSDDELITLLGEAAPTVWKSCA